MQIYSSRHSEDATICLCSTRTTSTLLCLFHNKDQFEQLLLHKIHSLQTLLNILGRCDMAVNSVMYFVLGFMAVFLCVNTAFKCFIEREHLNIYFNSPIWLLVHLFCPGYVHRPVFQINCTFFLFKRFNVVCLAKKSNNTSYFYCSVPIISYTKAYQVLGCR